ncbi:SMP-30/Gluconolaconase/LRE-like region-containing protein [Halostagnicola kamekurae]|uniref:SMP-30/Gluconolaconase/LRE-like region-containing protein n=1 Tax=Halostagnicola kamekurae TaxID=619731 RepID=A0A1I6TWD5_9EURY|nr:SMP-30/Gluconolaconase/LRE-like region-containing protein [Halostagnicola kamekurae]
MPKVTKQTITDRGQLFNKLDQVREQKYTVDNEERLAGRAVRYDLSGESVDELSVPALKVSSVTFAGPEYDELYLTTALEGGDREVEDDGADALFRATVLETGSSEEPLSTTPTNSAGGRISLRRTLSRTVTPKCRRSRVSASRLTSTPSRSTSPRVLRCSTRHKPLSRS